MSNLREAAQAALDALLLEATEPPIPQTGAAIDALRAALAAQPAPVQGEQQPVAWSPALSYPNYEKQRVWANGQPRQEDIDYWAKNGDGITYAYAAQPAAPVRQPLTDEQVFTSNEIMAVNASARLMMHTLLLLVRAVEAAHGIGEQGGAQ